MKNKIVLILFVFISSSFSQFNMTEYDKRIEKAISSPNPYSELRILRNEIFAKHGRIFKSNDLQDIFSKQKWYKQNSKYSDSMLSAIELKYVDKIGNIEKIYLPKKSNYGLPIWSDSSLSKVDFYMKEGRAIVVTRNQDFLYSYIYHCKSSYRDRIIISQTTTLNIDEGSEGFSPYLSAQAFLFSDIDTAIILWKINGEIDVGSVWDNTFYMGTQYGCCSMRNNVKMYNIMTGSLVLERTSDLYDIELPGSCKKRFIGYKCSETYSTFPYENDSLYIGTFTYTSKDSTIDKIVLKATNIAIRDSLFPMGDGDISYVDLEKGYQVQNNTHLTLFSQATNSKIATSTGFSIRIDFYSGEILVIPIIDDKFMIKDLKHKNITIERQK